MRLLLLLLFAIPACAQTTQTVRVVNAGNGWFLGKRLLVRGDSVELNAKLLGAQSAGEIVLECKRGWTAYSCKNGSCEVPVCSDQVDRARVQMDHAGLTAKLESFFRRQPKEPSTLGVRGVGDPSDAVLQITPLGIHWGPALDRVLEGRYCFVVTELPGGSAAAPTPRIVNLNWDREKDPTGLALASNLASGGYTLVKGAPSASGGCNVDRDSTAAWVVLAPQMDFPRLNSQWANFTSRVSRLEQNGASVSFAATLRRAFLAELADSVRPGR